MRSFNYLGLLFLPALVIAGQYGGGWWNLLTPVSCFIVHPLVSFVKKEKENARSSLEHVEINQLQFRLVALCMAPILLLLFTWSLTRLSLLNQYEIIGFALAVGTVNGIIGFTLAHEFIHRLELPEKISGLLLLLINNYLHYCVEHIGGHHVYACTNKDPNTARCGESFYQFLPRAIAGTYVNAWEIEKKQLNRKCCPFFSFKNRMLFYSCLQLFWSGVLLNFFGGKGLLFSFMQSSVAIFLLHIINYLQHYGLARRENAKGKLEKMAAHHSWNSGHSEQAFNLFQVERHADHHMHPDHPYEKLVQHHESPQLPGGYTSMICLALIPPLWFRTINKYIPSTPKVNHHEINI